MPEFIEIGARRVPAESITAIEPMPDGSVIVTFPHDNLTLTGDEAKAFLAWADKCTVLKRPEKKEEKKGAAGAEPDYESWTNEELHAEATNRDIGGRGTMNKADLVKALKKYDADAAKKK